MIFSTIFVEKLIVIIENIRWFEHNFEVKVNAINIENIHCHQVTIHLNEFRAIGSTLVIDQSDFEDS